MGSTSIIEKIKKSKSKGGKKSKRQHPEQYARQRTRTTANKKKAWKSHLKNHPNDKQGKEILSGKLIT